MRGFSRVRYLWKKEAHKNTNTTQPEEKTQTTKPKKLQQNQKNVLCIMFCSLALCIWAPGLFPGKRFPQLLRIFLTVTRTAFSLQGSKKILQYQQINTLVFSKTLFQFFPLSLLSSVGQHVQAPLFLTRNPQNSLFWSMIFFSGTQEAHLTLYYKCRL